MKYEGGGVREEGERLSVKEEGERFSVKEEGRIGVSELGSDLDLAYLPTHNRVTNIRYLLDPVPGEAHVGECLYEEGGG